MREQRARWASRGTCAHAAAAAADAAAGDWHAGGVHGIRAGHALPAGASTSSKAASGRGAPVRRCNASSQHAHARRQPGRALHGGRCDGCCETRRQAKAMQLNRVAIAIEAMMRCVPDDANAPMRQSIEGTSNHRAMSRPHLHTFHHGASRSVCRGLLLAVLGPACSMRCLPASPTSCCGNSCRQANTRPRCIAAPTFAARRLTAVRQMARC